MNLTKNQAAYLDWVAANYPAVYDAAVSGGLGAIQTSSGWSFQSIVQGVGDAANALLQYRADKDRLKINTNRVKAGCAPITDWNAPAPPCTGAQLQSGNVAAAVGSQIDNYLPVLIYGGIALGAILLFTGGSNKK